MNMNLEKIISSHFELDKCKDDKERVRLLSEKIKDIEELKTQMESVKRNLERAIRQRMFDSMKPYVKIKYPDLEPGYPEDYVGVSMMIGNKKTVISIQDDGKLYCQVEYDKREQRLEESLLIGLKDILPDPNKDLTCIWKYFNINDYEGVYSCFLEAVERCLNMKDK